MAQNPTRQQVELKFREFAKLVIERAQSNLRVSQYVTQMTSKGMKRRKVKRIASGRLEKALTYKLDMSRVQYVEMLFTAKGKAKDYYGVIEEGRGQNKTPPPYKDIMKWIAKKKIQPRDSSGRFLQKLKTKDEKKAMAIAMAKHIGKYGFAGIHYYRDAVNDVMDEKSNEFTTAYAQYLSIDLAREWTSKTN
jgi:hypothetical protein